MGGGGRGGRGDGGLMAAPNRRTWPTFVVPRLQYGLEVQSLKRKKYDSPERFQRHSLKQI